ncbi:MAG: FIST C-terminal domain-containing protein [Bacteroidetes bacterium]|nr:FIST C-terminal domain-containing protein [Bacteroidota bacterium]
MKASAYTYANGTFSDAGGNMAVENGRVRLVLCFGARHLLCGEGIYERLRALYPMAEIVLSSTAGEIFNNRVMDNTVSVTAIEFDRTAVRTAAVNIAEFDGDSHAAGAALVKDLARVEDLCHIMVVSDGSLVNGSALVEGVEEVVRHEVPVTGGIAGDGVDFRMTVVGMNAAPEPGIIAAIALYGRSLVVTHCTMGGYETFGPEITVTKSSGNRLYGIKGENALELYKKYLGTYANDLPGSALLFPLSVKLDHQTPPVVRTILSIDPAEGSMVFAGDIPEGAKVRFMRANFDKLIEAASEAALGTVKSVIAPQPALALLISCVGRKIILENRVDEEVEAVRDVYGEGTLLAGFYSYGEMCPFAEGTPCELHNQTMTITTFYES